MDIQAKVHQMDAMVSRGEILDAIDQFFSSSAITSDYGGVITSDKKSMVDKMQSFLGSIAQVKGITHHRSIIEGDHSASEFTFDFDMKDGSKIHWHEIIRRVWSQDGLVIREDYFSA